MSGTCSSAPQRHVPHAERAGEINSVTADLAFDDNHELVDFTSDDRLRASPDGKTFTPQ